MKRSGLQWCNLEGDPQIIAGLLMLLLHSNAGLDVLPSCLGELGQRVPDYELELVRVSVLLKSGLLSQGTVLSFFASPS